MQINKYVKAVKSPVYVVEKTYKRERSTDTLLAHRWTHKRRHLRFTNVM